MKALSEMTPIAKVLKTHGIHGEMNCETDIEFEQFEGLRCVFAELDGLLVPFFISSMRPRGSYGVLMTLEGISSEQEAALLSGKTLYAEKSELCDSEEGEGDGGFYLSDLVGWKVNDGEKSLGVVEDFDDTTENVLLLVRTTEGKILHIPAADELFEGIDEATQTITMDLPIGLIDLN